MSEFMGFVKPVVDLITTIVMPIICAYVGYVHSRLVEVTRKNDNLRELYYQIQTTINKDFATRQMVVELEVKISNFFNRIDDKVTKILEDRR